jgi:hypothetical protein
MKQAPGIQNSAILPYKDTKGVEFASKRGGNWVRLLFFIKQSLDTDNSNWYQPRHIFVRILATL